MKLEDLNIKIGNIMKDHKIDIILICGEWNQFSLLDGRFRARSSLQFYLFQCFKNWEISHKKTEFKVSFEKSDQ